jgi:hypothetical protein
MPKALAREEDPPVREPVEQGWPSRVLVVT